MVMEPSPHGVLADDNESGAAGSSRHNLAVGLEFSEWSSGSSACFLFLCSAATAFCTSACLCFSHRFSARFAAASFSLWKYFPSTRMTTITSDPGPHAVRPICCQRLSTLQVIHHWTMTSISDMSTPCSNCVSLHPGFCNQVLSTDVSPS